MHVHIPSMEDRTEHALETLAGDISKSIFLPVSLVSSSYWAIDEKILASGSLKFSWINREYYEIVY